MPHYEDVVLPQEHLLPHLLRRRAAEQPDEIAVEDVEGSEGGQRHTWGGFADLFLRWADAFRRFGVEAGHPVTTMLPGRSDNYAIWLGLSWIKGIEAPLNTQYKGPMLRYACNYVGAGLMVLHSRFLPVLKDVCDQLEHLRTVVLVDPPDRLPKLPFEVFTAEDFLHGAEPAADEPGPQYYDIACMIFTSGTTGPSKGVLMPWAEVYELPTFQPPETIQWGNGTYYNCLPLFHTSGKAGLYLAALASARTVVRETFSVTEFWGDVRRYNCEATTLVGPLAALLLEAPEQPDDKDNPLGKAMIAPLIPGLDEFKKRFDVEVYTGYGMTEIGVPLASDGFKLANNTSCGRVRGDYEVRVVNPVDEPLGPGEVGELIVRHRHPWRLNAGYWNLPEKTAEAWRNGWFHTGDGFSYDEDGNFYFVDRMKDAIRRRGENISSFEVEQYVLEHEDVIEAAAIAVPSEYGEDEIKLVVFGEEKLTPDGLIEWLRPRMPRFMIPRYVEIWDSELPKTLTLRVQKVKLREDPLNERTWDREKGRTLQQDELPGR